MDALLLWRLSYRINGVCNYWKKNREIHEYIVFDTQCVSYTHGRPDYIMDKVTHIAPAALENKVFTFDIDL